MKWYLLGFRPSVSWQSVWRKWRVFPIVNTTYWSCLSSKQNRARSPTLQLKGKKVNEVQHCITTNIGHLFQMVYLVLLVHIHEKFPVQHIMNHFLTNDKSYDSVHCIMKVHVFIVPVTKYAKTSIYIKLMSRDNWPWVIVQSNHFVTDLVMDTLSSAMCLVLVVMDISI